MTTVASAPKDMETGHGPVEAVPAPAEPASSSAPAWAAKRLAASLERQDSGILRTSLKEEETSKGISGRPALVAASGLCIGMLFGIALEKGRVFVPEVIVDQFKLTNFTMVKMFLSAVATSLFVMIALDRTSKRAQDNLHNVRSALVCYFPPNIVVVALGAFVLGVGMAVSGSCPGTTYAQLGAGTSFAWSLVVGGVLGALTWGLVHDHVDPYLARLPSGGKRARAAMEAGTLDKWLGVAYWKLALPLALFLWAVVALFEVFLPYRDELDLTGADFHGSDPFKYLAWPPQVAGVIIGLLQLPNITLHGDSLGTSQSYMTAVAALARTVQHAAGRMLHARAPAAPVDPETPGDVAMARPLVRTESYFDKFHITEWGMLWQVMVVVGIALGALISAAASGTVAETDSANGPWLGALGGFLSILGARIACGCTSGHGISGFSMLSVSSFVAVPCMFAGGILVSLLPGL